MDRVRHFSLAIIGSGSGNVLVPEFRAGPVALIEAGDFGGTCLHRGCIPSKIFAHTADVAAEIRRAAGFGLGAELTRVDWKAIQDRVFCASTRSPRTAAAAAPRRAA